jgi:hypothetical protein
MMAFNVVSASFGNGKNGKFSGFVAVKERI